MRVRGILKEEGINIGGPSLQGIAEVIMRYAPDWRRVLNELQKASISMGAGNFDVTSLLLNADSGNYEGLFKALKDKEFKKMRSWVANNVDTDTSQIFRAIYDSMYERVEPASIPQLVVLLADYQYKNAFVADHELNMVACFTEIMGTVEFQ